MTEMNHKLIYDAAPLFEALRAQRRKADAERLKADSLEVDLAGQIAKLAGLRREEIETERSHCCIARGIGNHVWKATDGRSKPYNLEHGLGKRVCIFCGCDDFSD